MNRISTFHIWEQLITACSEISFFLSADADQSAVLETKKQTLIRQDILPWTWTSQLAEPWETNAKDFQITQSQEFFFRAEQSD